MLDLLATIVAVDPPSLVAWLVLAFAAGMYPLGLMLGAPCSPCCSGPCRCGLRDRTYEQQNYTGQIGVPSDQHFAGRYCCSGDRPQEITVRLTMAGTVTHGGSDGVDYWECVTSFDEVDGDYVLQATTENAISPTERQLGQCIYAFDRSPQIAIEAIRLSPKPTFVSCQSSGVQRIELLPDGGPGIEEWPKWSVNSWIYACHPISCESSKDLSRFYTQATTFVIPPGTFTPIFNLLQYDTRTATTLDGFRTQTISARLAIDGNQDDIPQDYIPNGDDLGPYDWRPIYTEQNCSLQGVELSKITIVGGELERNIRDVGQLTFTPSGILVKVEVL